MSDRAYVIMAKATSTHGVSGMYWHPTQGWVGNPHPYSLDEARETVPYLMNPDMDPDVAAVYRFGAWEDPEVMENI